MNSFENPKKLKGKERDSTPDFWKDGYLRLFISHITSDKVIAQGLKDKLSGYGISCFVAHSDIEPTSEWMHEIESALTTCDAVLAIMSPKFHESKWTDQEIGIAMGLGKLLIPVMMGKEPYGFIGKYQAIIARESEIPVDKIINAFIKNVKTGKAISYALMQIFEDSNSYAAAKSNIDLIKRIEYWDNVLIERLKNSAKNNSQIRRSFGVPDIINNLLEKFEN